MGYRHTNNSKSVIIPVRVYVCMPCVRASSAVHLTVNISIERREIESFASNLISRLIYENCIPRRRKLLRFTKRLMRDEPIRRATTTNFLKNSFLRRNRDEVKNVNSGPRMAVVTQRSVKLRAFVRERSILARITIYLTQDLEIPRRGHGSDLDGNWPGRTYYYPNGPRPRERRLEKVSAKLCEKMSVSLMERAVGNDSGQRLLSRPNPPARVLTAWRIARLYLERIAFMTNISALQSRLQTLARRFDISRHSLRK